MSDHESGPRRSERINLRVEPEADELLRAAARAQHKSLSAFMVESALERAREIMDVERRIVLQAEEFDRIIDELERPGRVITPLVEVARRPPRSDLGVPVGTPRVSKP
jgi:uncharacterized protein (DUF1778 family)